MLLTRSISPARHGLLFALLGVGMGLGQAPTNAFIITLISLAFVLYLYQRLTTAKQAFFYIWLLGVGYFAFTLRWLISPFLIYPERDGWMAPFALLFMAAGLALFWATSAALSYKVHKKSPLFFALSLTAFEAARALIFTGFPWGLIGHTLINTPYAQLAKFTGPHTLSLVLALGAWSLHGIWAAPRSQKIVPALCFTLILSLWPILHLSTQSTEIAPDAPLIRLVQPNAPQHQKWDTTYSHTFFERQLQLSQTTSKHKAPNLIVWPEASIATLLNYAQPHLEAMTRANIKAPILTGINRQSNGLYYNSAVTIENGVPTNTYDKKHLVPFGEYNPLVNWINSFQLFDLDILNGASFSPGERAQLLHVEGVGSLLPLICYEGIFSEEITWIERPRALVLITNDAWFGQGAGPKQHLAQAQLRAIEQGLPMVRVANTGISAMIDAQGRILSSLPLQTAGALDAALPSQAALTPYSQYGDWPLCIFLALFGLCISFSLRRAS